jgi:Anthrone oxygenase
VVADGKAGLRHGALLMLANWPWTMFVIMPTNKTLMATELDQAGPQTRVLLLKWNNLHAVRTGFGGLAIVAFLLALSPN